MFLQPPSYFRLSLTLAHLFATDRAGAVDGTQIVVGCLLEPMVVDATANPYQRIVILIVLMGAAVIIAPFAIFLDALGYPLLASLLGWLMVGVAAALYATEALQVEVHSLTMPVVGGIVAMYLDVGLCALDVLDASVLIFVAVLLTCQPQEVGRVELTIAILAALAIQPIGCRVGDIAVLTAVGGDFAILTVELGGHKVQLGCVVKLVHPLEELIGGHRLLYLSAFANGTLTVAVSACGTVGYQFARLNDEVTVVFAVEGHGVVGDSIVFVLEGVVIAIFCFKSCTEVVAGFLM